MRHGAIEEGEIRVEAWVFGRAVFRDVVALVGGLMDETTLRGQSETDLMVLDYWSRTSSSVDAKVPTSRRFKVVYDWRES